MRYPGFCGPSGASQSAIANSERLINWYEERMESRGAPTDALLLPTPGQRPFNTSFPGVGVRGALDLGSRAFVVIGTDFCEFFADGNIISRGVVVQDSNLATLYPNGAGHVFITSGTHGYCFTLASGAFVQVLVGEATMGGAKDGFCLALNRETGLVKLSALNDATTWPGGQYQFARSLAPDPWQAMIVGNPEIWLLGKDTGEGWYNAGNFPQPFAPIPGAFFTYGTQAPFSVQLAGNRLVWLSHSKEGSGQIVGMQGYTPQPLGTYAVNTSIRAAETLAGIDDCETLVYQQGHTFASFSFTNANLTWVLDLETGAWHERGTWRPTLHRYDAWHPRVHVHAFGKHFVGERGTGVISELDLTYGLEADGGPIRRVRVAPPLWATRGERLQVSRFDLWMDTGLGALVGQGVDPMAMLRVSTDGRTWGPERMASAGRRGAYGSQVSWTRCISSEGMWMPELVVSDPVPWKIAGAEIDGSGIQMRAA